ncbi:hypothetical protein LCGC14_0720270 [marine sediment metagenome]|uniref:Uncharacterized protein n=1 Tax=marine sediment metagenome TaxID=412755 RepID=A0A0F9TK05_9ZZZZ
MEKLLNLKTITLLKAVITSIMCADFERFFRGLYILK